VAKFERFIRGNFFFDRASGVICSQYTTLLPSGTTVVLTGKSVIRSGGAVKFVQVQSGIIAFLPTVQTHDVLGVDCSTLNPDTHNKVYKRHVSEDRDPHTPRCPAPHLTDL